MPSSVINHFTYNNQTQTLEITFVTGLVYRYKKVPEEIYKMLKVAGSKGRYFNYHIKDKYVFKKIDD